MYYRERRRKKRQRAQWQNISNTAILLLGQLRIAGFEVLTGFSFMVFLFVGIPILFYIWR